MQRVTLHIEGELKVRTRRVHAANSFNSAFVSFRSRCRTTGILVAAALAPRAISKLESAVFALSDDELDVVMHLAAPLPPQNRNGFLEAIAAELQARGGEVGPGSGAPHRQ